MDTPIQSIKSVHIVAEPSGWCVLLTESGETTRHSFELESFAVSFATGQRIRLGLTTLPDAWNSATVETVTA